MYSIMKTPTLLVLLQLLIVLKSVSSSHDIVGKIVDGTGCDRVSLNHGERYAFCKSDNSFTFHDVEDGTYALEIESMSHRYPQYKVNVKERVQAIKYDYPGAEKERVAYPLRVKANSPVKYFEIRQGFSVLGMLKSPTILMMLPMVGIMFCMKYLVDPEELKKMQKQAAEEAKKAKAK
jgi:hypothetical protein